jgi:hypothetical protein
MGTTLHSVNILAFAPASLPILMRRAPEADHLSHYTRSTEVLHPLSYTPSWHDRSRDSSVGIAIGYVLDDRGVGVRVR